MFNFWKIPPNVFPILFGVGYLLFIIFLRQKAPAAEEVVITLRILYEQHGYLLVFIGALLEGNFLLGFYIPGSTVMLLGAALSKEGILFFPLVVLLGTLGLTTAYSVNYLMGKYGWYHILAKIGMQGGIDVAQEKLQKYHWKAFFLGYFSPGSAAFLSTAAGVVGYSFKNFLLLSFLSQLLWSLFWGSIAYYFGLKAVEFFLHYFIYVVIVLGAIWIIKRVLKK